MRIVPKRPINRTGPQNPWIDAKLDPRILDTPDMILEYCREMGFINGRITDIESLIKANPELTLIYEDLGSNDAYIKKISEQKYVISINSRHHPNRQRFSMAHEYMHYQLHRDRIADMPEGERILYRSARRDQIEYQANSGAAAILMPESSFAAAIKETDGNIREIAAKFALSADAVRVRAEQLGFSIRDV